MRRNDIVVIICKWSVLGLWLYLRVWVLRPLIKRLDDTFVLCPLSYPDYVAFGTAKWATKWLGYVVSPHNIVHHRYVYVIVHLKTNIVLSET